MTPLSTSGRQTHCDRLERGGLQDGFADLTDHDEKKIGEVYADFSEGTF